MATRRAIIFVIASVLFWTSTATAWAGPRYNAAPVQLRTFHEPAADVEAEVELGQSLVAAGKLLPAIEVKEAATARVAGNKVTIPAGLYSLASRSEDGSFYQAADSNLITLSALGMGGTWPDGGVYVPDDESAPPSVYYLNALGMVFHKPIPDLKFAQALPLRLSNGFRREMLYGGVAKGVITLNYREFVNDMARPAFSQALTYDLAEGDEIGFRGARIKILKATNTTLRYVVIKPLSSEQ